MTLFVKKDSPSTPPEVAECEKKIAELEGRRTAALIRIGEIFLQNTSPEKAAGTPYEEKIKEIHLIDIAKDYQEKRKLVVQGMRKCEKCGNILALNSLFCNKCGERLKSFFPEEEKKAHVCPQCGTSYTEDAFFCISCGYKLK